MACSRAKDFPFADYAGRIFTEMSNSALAVSKRMVPSLVRRWLRAQQRAVSVWPPVGWVRLGRMRRMTPVSRVFGIERGESIDRYYIESFLSRYEKDIRGHVLEIADNSYTRQFGGERVVKSDVLHVQAGNPQATIIADLTSADHVGTDAFDCIILTQTLQFIYDLRPAIMTLHRILRPGGVLLATLPGISQISRYDMERWGDYWRFTTRSAQRLFEEAFLKDNLTVESCGNVLAANAFLHGLATEDLRRQELDYRDGDYQLLITVKAVKSEVRP